MWIVWAVTEWMWVFVLHRSTIFLFQWQKHTYVHFGSVLFHSPSLDLLATLRGVTLQKEKWALFINLLYRSLITNSLYDILQMMCLWDSFSFACPLVGIYAQHTHKQRERRSYAYAPSYRDTKYSWFGITHFLLHVSTFIKIKNNSNAKQRATQIVE